MHDSCLIAHTIHFETYRSSVLNILDCSWRTIKNGYFSFNVRQEKEDGIHYQFLMKMRYAGMFSSVREGIIHRQAIIIFTPTKKQDEGCFFRFCDSHHGGLLEDGRCFISCGGFNNCGSCAGRGGCRGKDTLGFWVSSTTMCGNRMRCTNAKAHAS